MRCNAACADNTCFEYGGGAETCLGSCVDGYVRQSTPRTGCGIAHRLAFALNLLATAQCGVVNAPALTTADFSIFLSNLGGYIGVKVSQMALIAVTCTEEVNSTSLYASGVRSVSFASFIINSLSDVATISSEAKIAALSANVTSVVMGNVVTKLSTATVTAVLSSCNVNCRTCYLGAINSCTSCNAGSVLSTAGANGVVGGLPTPGLCVPSSLSGDDDTASGYVSPGTAAGIVIGVLIALAFVVVPAYKAATARLQRGKARRIELDVTEAAKNGAAIQPELVEGQEQGSALDSDVEIEEVGVDVDEDGNPVTAAAGEVDGDGDALLDPEAAEAKAKALKKAGKKAKAREKQLKYGRSKRSSGVLPAYDLTAVDDVDGTGSDSRSPTRKGKRKSRSRLNLLSAPKPSPPRTGSNSQTANRIRQLLDAGVYHFSHDEDTGKDLLRHASPRRAAVSFEEPSPRERALVRRSSKSMKKRRSKSEVAAEAMISSLSSPVGSVAAALLEFQSSERSSPRQRRQLSDYEAVGRAGGPKKLWPTQNSSKMLSPFQSTSELDGSPFDYPV